jgi:hypothetical protein
MTLQPNARAASRRGLFPRAGLLLLAGLVLLAGGCARHVTTEQIPKLKFLVLPFAQPSTMRENTNLIRGWWLGATTVRQNERSGDMMADTLSRQMAHLDYLNLYSSIDLKYYFANKVSRLKNTYGSLSDDDANALIWKVPKLEFAKDLGADKMLTGDIVRQYMGENRTFHWWWAVIEADVQVTDVASGKVEWSRHYNLRRQLASMSDMQEELTTRLLEDLKKEYFLPMARK